ncbi:hypothetical protein B0I31_11160 [Saccharothrix carnea]|uniref:Uncharacterized protein n=1 Tax=Saccharothrix carnea TaxID=1280637 RepID=A0A2P8I2U9_SACCR|nr:hypothetical protein B0I31_11160 [Saccharothrix carnea]
MKATLLRITLHVVHADDYPALHTAMRPTLRGARLLGFLADREPTVYRRYDRWWADLPAAEVRVLPGG